MVFNDVISPADADIHTQATANQNTKKVGLLFIFNEWVVIVSSQICMCHWRKHRRHICCILRCIFIDGIAMISVSFLLSLSIHSSLLMCYSPLCISCYLTPSQLIYSVSISVIIYILRCNYVLMYFCCI